MGYVLISVILAFSACLLYGLLFGPRIQLNWAQFDAKVGEEIIFVEREGGVGRSAPATQIGY
jgi:hypothetical protein